MDFFPETYGCNNHYYTPWQQQQWRKYQEHQKALREEQTRRERLAAMQRRQKAYEDYERARRRRRGFQQSSSAMDTEDVYFHYPRSHVLSTNQWGYPSPLDHDDDRYIIVRGSDRRLYRVRKGDLKESYPDGRDKSVSQTNERFTEATGSVDETEANKARSTEDDVSVQVHYLEMEDDEDEVDTVEKNSVESKAQKNKNVQPKISRRKRFTVIVEDASDSEYEDDERHSVWKNRRPCPETGESWMEPVAA